MLNDTLITEVSSGAFFANPFFLKAFGENLPDWGHHLVFFYRVHAMHFLPLSYVNFLAHEEVMLVGGGVTNGEAFKLVEASHAAQMRAEGGLLFQLLRHGFTTFADRCDAFFGYTGDPRAYEVDLKAGFQPTQHPHLIVHFHKPLDAQRREELIQKIHGIGPF